MNVAPGEVLRVDYAVNYRGAASQFDLANIKITGSNGTVDLQGSQAQTQFKPEGNDYIIRYK